MARHRTVLFILVALIPATVSAQGIDYFKGSLDAARESARAEGKLILAVFPAEGG